MPNCIKVKQVTTGLIVIAALFTSACSNSTSSPTAKLDGDFQAVIASVSSDYGSSEISLANTALEDDPMTEKDESSASYDIINGYAGQDLSDISVASYGKYFYRIGRYLQDNITKYSFDNPNQDVWQFSVNDDGETGSNPQDIIFVNDTKAYVLRYGSSSIWEINPSVDFNDEENFKTDEIDLSAYASGIEDDVPEMKAGVIHDGILYVVLQNMVSWVPDTAILVMIDVATNVVTNSQDLNVKNPIDLDVLGDHLYITGVGRYGDSFSQPVRDPEYTGGIEKINLTDYTSRLLVDDGDAASHPYGQFNGLTLVSETLGYFQGYAGWKNLSLYQFNPTSGAVDATPVDGFAGVDIRVAEVSVEGQLWVGIGDDANPEIQIINPADNSLVETIYTDKIPAAIVFSGDLSE